MPWIALSENDLRSSITGPEDNAIRTAALADGQGDPYVSARDQVVAMFRNAIRSGPGNQLDPNEGTLPAAAIYHAVAKLRYRLLTRFASELIDEDRRTENKEAEAWLNAVRRGIEKIEQPGDSPASTHSPKISLLSNHGRQATRENLAGL